MRVAVVAILSLLASTVASAFRTASTPGTRAVGGARFAARRNLPPRAAGEATATTTTTALPMSGEGEGSSSSSSSAPPVSPSEATTRLQVPLTFDEMARQASSAMRDASDSGLNRQVLRVLLPRDPMNDRLGQQYEADADIGTSNLVLAPPDETWQGGIMQLYRAAAPTCREILRLYSGDVGGVPPKMTEDRSVDQSGVDGVGLWMIESSTSAADDVMCFVQPTQEIVDSIESVCDQAGDSRTVVLLNPQWRNVDDALDVASKSGGFLGGLASFLGGKGQSLQRLEDAGFTAVYTLEGYVCRGGNVRMVKRHDTDWGIFAENDAGTDYIAVGSSSNRPTYQDVDAMLEEKGIALKYARDIGLAPKL